VIASDGKNDAAIIATMSQSPDRHLIWQSAL
jgi:hypothetical protein